MLCRILLVDDDPAMLNALRAELLRKPDLGDEGIEIESFASAAEAIDRAGVHHFVAKPWDADALRGVVAEAIRHRDLPRAAG
jgi:FixJ family two-component response regulator